MDNNQKIEARRNRRLVCQINNDSCNLDTDTVEQLSRITLTIDDIADAQSLFSGSDAMKSYDLVAVCPTNAKVLSFLCQNSFVDIISIDFRQKLGFGWNKRHLDIALSRGIYFEIIYSPILNSPQCRKDYISNTRILIQFLRGISCEYYRGVVWLQ
jgi:ribonuclease P/MRP protein subunit RPP1